MSAHCIHTIEQYYKVLVDGVNLEYMPVKFKNCNGRFFSQVEDQWYMYDVLDIEKYLTPHILLTFDQNEAVTEESWELVYRWLLAAFSNTMTDELNAKMLALVPKEEVAEPVPAPEILSLKNTVPTEYAFRYIIDESRDIALFEVIKPNTPQPYTALVRNFKKRGFLPFFTALYVCTSWGVSSYDHLFLVKIWEHLGMIEKYGELNLEQRLKEDIARCSADNPGGAEAEPEVYRLYIYEVMEKWGMKRIATHMDDEFVMVDKKARKDIDDFIQK